jgi:hypothetical protein
MTCSHRLSDKLLGDLPAARAAFERALKIMEKYAPDDPNTKIVRGNLERVAATDK